MNHKTQALYQFLMDHALEFTQDWANRREIVPGSDYSADAPPERAKEVTEHNTGYARLLATALIQTEDEIKESIANWTSVTAAHRVNSDTSLTEVVRNSGVFRRLYWDYVKKFVRETDLEVTAKDVLEWEEVINFALDYVLETFTDYFMDIFLKRLNAQSSLILELSTPIIPLSDTIGLLPIIGDIDTSRAKWIMESTLQQSVDLKITHLIIDLSGVVMVDTMVAMQIFRVMNSLKLVGVETTLLGIRPEVAQTAIQIGIDFKDVRTVNSLKKVLKTLKYN